MSVLLHLSSLCTVQHGSVSLKDIQRSKYFIVKDTSKTVSSREDFSEALQGCIWDRNVKFHGIVVFNVVDGFLGGLFFLFIFGFCKEELVGFGAQITLSVLMEYINFVVSFGHFWGKKILWMLFVLCDTHSPLLSSPSLMLRLNT